jgi:hypothetical protein
VFVSGWNFYAFRLAAMLDTIVARLTPKSNKPQGENGPDSMLRCSETPARERRKKKPGDRPGLICITRSAHSLIVVVL